MGQNRVFYACQAVGIGAYNAEQYVEGVQSVGVNTTFDFEQAFELGVLTIYENMEGIPSVEVTMERNLVSGVQPLWYTIANGGSNGSVNDSGERQVIAVGDSRPSVVLQVFKDNVSFVGAATNEEAYYVRMSGMYLSNYSMNVNVDGPATESLTFTGNDYEWYASSSINRLNGGPLSGASFSASGLVFKRQHFANVNSTNLGFSSWLPNTSLIGGSGLQSVSVSIDFGREDILELGRKAPYYKAPNYPVEISTEIEYVQTNTVLDTPTPTRQMYDSYDFTSKQTNDATKPIPLGFTLGDIGVFIGSGNRLTGTSTTGGDAGGGNATITFSFQTFNELAIKAKTATHFNKNYGGSITPFI